MYFDDNAILTLLNDNDSVTYQHSITHFIQWRNSNYLQLLVRQRNWFSTHCTSLNPIFTNGEKVEHVGSFKYIGITVDNEPTFDPHTTDVKCCQQGLSAICRLKALFVDPHLLSPLHKSIIQSIILCCSPFSHCAVCLQQEQIASKIIGSSQPLTSLISITHPSPTHRP